jgi:uncharacterized membrane protein YeaQ/YmgE (transglycosylase-associated protein family)
MDLLTRIIVGGLAGWLTGKAAEAEGHVNGVSERHRSDFLYGIIGGVLGKHLLFWTVIGPGDAFSNCATAAIGAIIAVGVARFVRSKMASR